MAKEKAGGGRLWQENEFLANGLGDRTSEAEEAWKTEPAADPIGLRMGRSIHVLIKADKSIQAAAKMYGMIKAAMIETPQKDFEQYRKSAAQSVKSGQGLIEEAIGRLGQLITLAETNEEVTKDKNAKASVERVMRWGSEVVQVLTNLEEKEVGEEEFAQRWVSAASGFIAELRNEAMNIMNIRSIEEADIQRSEAMHEAAQKGAGARGIWKVGENHVKDIVTNATGLQYVVMTNEEFERDNNVKHVYEFRGNSVLKQGPGRFYSILGDKTLRSKDISSWLLAVREAWEGLTFEQQEIIRQDKERYPVLKRMSEEMTAMLKD